jgi:hypothetical protein
MPSGRFQKNVLGLVCLLVMSVGALSAPIQSSTGAEETPTAGATSGPDSSGADRQVSTGSKSMDTLLNAKISSDRPQRPEAVGGVARPAAAASASMNLDAMSPLSSERARPEAAVKEWAQALAAKDRERDNRSSGLSGGMSFGGRSSGDSAGGDSAPPAPPSGWLAWPMALIALIRENRLVVLGVAAVLLIMSAMFVSRQNRSRR